MPVIRVRHVTIYRYKQPVGFGEHRMMLRPRDSYDQKLLESSLQITPEPIELPTTRATRLSANAGCEDMAASRMTSGASSSNRPMGRRPFDVPGRGLIVRAYSGGFIRPAP